ncbi:MAG: hypothetical protein IPO04_17985 [Cytophagaceae bacterium]|nr:hypothetical protein [Cytophagaceae bacterium]
MFPPGTADINEEAEYDEPLLAEKLNKLWFLILNVYANSTSGIDLMNN